MAKNKYDKLYSVAHGATINGAYKLPPGEALKAFLNDLKKLLEDYRNA